MAEQPLHRRGIHERSPVSRKKNQEQSFERDDQLDNAQPGNRSPRSRGRHRKGNQLYPDLHDTHRYPDDHLSDTEEGDEEEDTPDKPKRGVTHKQKAKKDRSPVAPVREPQVVQKDQSSSCCWSFILITAACAIGIGLLQMLIQDKDQIQPPPVNSRIDHYALFMPKFNDLKRQFPSQSERFWRIVGSPLRRVLKANQSEYPAILLVGVPVNGSQTASCFSKKLVEKVNAVYSNKAEFYIDANDVLKPSPARTKLELDNKMKQALTPGNGVVVDHIEKLPPEGALLLHGYCDGDNAPFKTSVIVLVFHTEKDFGSLNDRTFEDHLTDLWQAGLGPDEMPALRARIANSVIIINPETSLIC